WALLRPRGAKHPVNADAVPGFGRRVTRCLVVERAVGCQGCDVPPTPRLLRREVREDARADDLIRMKEVVQDEEARRRGGHVLARMIIVAGRPWRFPRN